MDKSELEDIVRSIASLLPPAAIVDNVPVCMMCGSEFNAETLSNNIRILEFHDDECPWRRAKEYVATI